MSTLFPTLPRAASLCRAIAVFALLGIACSTGCGRSDRPPLGRVQGKVTLNGRPLPNALVVFQPTKGRISCDTTNGEGHYDLVFLREVRGAIVGKHRIQITTQAPEDFRKEIVPACYNTKMTLEREVAASDNEINFDLTSIKK